MTLLIILVNCIGSIKPPKKAGRPALLDLNPNFEILSQMRNLTIQFLDDDGQCTFFLSFCSFRTIGLFFCLFSRLHSILSDVVIRPDDWMNSSRGPIYYKFLKSVTINFYTELEFLDKLGAKICIMYIIPRYPWALHLLRHRTAST